MNNKNEYAIELRMCMKKNSVPRILASREGI